MNFILVVKNGLKHKETKFLTHLFIELMNYSEIIHLLAILSCLN